MAPAPSRLPPDAPGRRDGRQGRAVPRWAPPLPPTGPRAWPPSTAGRGSPPAPGRGRVPRRALAARQRVRAGL